MRCTRGIARRAIVMLFASFAGCADFTLALREVLAPVPAPVKTAPPVADPAKAEPAAPVKAEPPVNAESRQMYQQALAALGAGRYSEAERALLAVIRREPELAGPRANIGILYDLYLQDAAKAMQHYQRYRELVPREAGTVTKWIADLQQRGRAAEQAKGGK